MPVGWSALVARAMWRSVFCAACWSAISAVIPDWNARSRLQSMLVSAAIAAVSTWALSAHASELAIWSRVLRAVSAKPPQRKDVGFLAALALGAVLLVAFAQSAEIFRGDGAGAPDTARSGRSRSRRARVRLRGHDRPRSRCRRHSELRRPCGATARGRGDVQGVGDGVERV